MGLLGQLDRKGTADFKAPKSRARHAKSPLPWAEAGEEAPSIRRAQARSEQWLKDVTHGQHGAGSRTQCLGKFRFKNP